MKALKAAAAKVLGATWQRCRVHFMRNALAHAHKGQREMIAAMIRTAFAQPDYDAAVLQWRQVADNLRPKVEKLAALHGRGRGRCSRLHDLPQGAAHQAAFDESPWSVSTRRSNDATTLSASFPTRPPSNASSAPCFMENNEEWMTTSDATCLLRPWPKIMQPQTIEPAALTVATD